MTNLISDGKSWAQTVVALYEEGRSDAEVAAELRISIKKYYQHIKDNPVFAQLVDYGRTLAQAWWEGQARKNLATKGFNSSLFGFYMKNKFGWADKVEQTSTTENTNINLDELRTQIYSKLRDFERKNQPEITDAESMFSATLKLSADEQL